MERKVTYQMRGILDLATGEIVYIDKNNGETSYPFMQILRNLDGNEIKMTIVYTETEDEGQEE